MKISLLALLATLVTIPLVHAQSTAPAAPPVAKRVAPQKAYVASPKFGADGKVNPGFAAAHEKFVKEAQEGKAKLVFLGDSITAGWARNQEIWKEAFGRYDPVNFGIGGDRTQHVLWRITNGELEGIKPKAIVLMIGTNNAGGDTAEDIAKGVTTIVETIRAKQPQAKLLLLGIFPRGDKPSGQLGEINDKLVQVNSIISKLDDGEHITFLDIGSRFPRSEGALDASVMPDFLHLSAAGYQIWADAIKDTLAELMK